MMDVKRAAARLGVSPSTLYDMVNRREITHRRVRTRIMFEEMDVSTYLENHRVDAAGGVSTAKSPLPFLKHLRLAGAKP